MASLVINDLAQPTFDREENTDSCTRAGRTIEDGASCSPEINHSRTPAGASSDHALTASIMCSETTLIVHSRVASKLVNVYFSLAARPENPTTKTGGS